MTAIDAAREIRTAAALTDYEIEDLDALWCAVRDNGRWLDVLAAMSREEVADRLFDLWEQCRIKVSVRDLIEPIVEQTARDMGIQCPAEIEVD